MIITGGPSVNYESSLPSYHLHHVAGASAMNGSAAKTSLSEEGGKSA